MNLNIDGEWRTWRGRPKVFRWVLCVFRGYLLLHLKYEWQVLNICYLKEQNHVNVNMHISTLLKLFAICHEFTLYLIITLPACKDKQWKQTAGEGSSWSDDAVSGKEGQWIAICIVYIKYPGHWGSERSNIWCTMYGIEGNVSKSGGTNRILNLYLQLIIEFLILIIFYHIYCCKGTRCWRQRRGIRRTKAPGFQGGQTTTRVCRGWGKDCSGAWKVLDWGRPVRNPK